MTVSRIDFREWADASPSSRLRAARAMGDAVRSQGFFYLTHSEVTEERANALFSAARAFFELPEERKLARRWTSPLGNIGYTPYGVEALDETRAIDLKEVFTFPPAGGTWEARAVETVWPDAEDDFRRVSDEFALACFRLGTEVFRALALAFDLPEGYFADRHRAEDQGMRLFHYFASDRRTRAEQHACGDHSDHGSLSLVVQDDAGGLEFVDRQGRWLPLPPLAGSVLVNPGDMLARWAGPAVRSAPHHVLAGAGERFSLGYFLVPRLETVLNCPSTSVLPGVRERPEGLTAEEFLLLRSLRRYDRFFSHHGLMTKGGERPPGMRELRGRMAERLGIEPAVLEQRLEQFGDVDTLHGAPA